MADKKISALTAASTPLAGTEVLPIVQSGATVKVATDDLTVKNIRSNATSGLLQVTGPAAASTCVMTTPNANFTAARTDAAQSFTGNQTLSTGNLIIGTSGNGIDFSATPGTGTSELLADYEEGTFNPVIAGTTTIGTATYASQVGRYTKIGRQVSFEIAIDWSAGSGAGSLRIAGLPFTSSSTATYPAASIGIIDSVALALTTYPTAFVRTNDTQISLRESPTGGGSSTDVAYDAAGFISLSGFYTV